jgi:DNA-directed RNA polymerase specialized sigma24 family protein
MANQELLLTERHAALREAFTCLPPRCQRLLALLVRDPPVPHTHISAKLGIPVGSIEPTRSRCLQELRRHPAIAALFDAEQANAPPGARAR